MSGTQATLSKFFSPVSKSAQVRLLLIFAYLLPACISTCSIVSLPPFLLMSFRKHRWWTLFSIPRSEARLERPRLRTYFHIYSFLCLRIMSIPKPLKPLFVASNGFYTRLHRLKSLMPINLNHLRLQQSAPRLRRPQRKKMPNLALQKSSLLRGPHLRLQNRPQKRHPRSAV
jgi:hypothetical protein